MSTASTVVMTSIVETTSTRGNVTTTSFSPSGEPYAAAMVEAVTAFYPRLTAQPTPTAQDLNALIGSKVTLLRSSQGAFGARSIIVQEGTLHPLGAHDDGSGQKIALIPKGARTRGLVMSCASVLDVQPGFGHQDLLRDRAQSVAQQLPVLEELTSEHLTSLPSPEDTESQASDAALIGLAVMGTWRATCVRSPGAIWLIHCYDPSADIADGYLLLSQEHGYSEHGSIYGRQLLTFGGRILDPPELTFSDAFALGNLAQQEWLPRFVTPAQHSTTPAR